MNTLLYKYTVIGKAVSIIKVNPIAHAGLNAMRVALILDTNIPLLGDSFKSYYAMKKCRF